jgi:hypothetical protein
MWHFRRKLIKIIDSGNGFLEMMSKNIKERENPKSCN